MADRSGREGEVVVASVSEVAVRKAVLAWVKVGVVGVWWALVGMRVVAVGVVLVVAVVVVPVAVGVVVTTFLKVEEKRGFATTKIF